MPQNLARRTWRFALTLGPLAAIALTAVNGVKWFWSDRPIRSAGVDPARAAAARPRPGDLPPGLAVCPECAVL